MYKQCVIMCKTIYFVLYRYFKNPVSFVLPISQKLRCWNEICIFCGFNSSTGRLVEHLMFVVVLTDHHQRCYSSDQQSSFLICWFVLCISVLNLQTLQIGHFCWLGLLSFHTNRLIDTCISEVWMEQMIACEMIYILCPVCYKHVWKRIKLKIWFFFKYSFYITCTKIVQTDKNTENLIWNNCNWNKFQNAI